MFHCASKAKWILLKQTNTTSGHRNNIVFRQIQAIIMQGSKSHIFSLAPSVMIPAIIQFNKGNFPRVTIIIMIEFSKEELASSISAARVKEKGWLNLSIYSITSCYRRRFTAINFGQSEELNPNYTQSQGHCVSKWTMREKLHSCDTMTP